MKNNELYILLIGPRLNQQKTNVGGATQSFEYLLQYFQKNNISHNIINTQKYQGIFSLLHFLVQYLKFIWKSDVVFLNTSQNGIKYMAPVACFLTKWLDKKIIIRPFGSALKEIFEQSGGLQRKIFERTILKADILYLQTKTLIDFFKPISKQVKQLVTSRNQPDPSLLRGDRPYQKRFLFLGHVKKAKGLDELLAAFNRLDNSYSLDIYGPIGEPKYEYLKNDKSKGYKGALKGEKEVLQTIQEYDVVVLPTYYDGEGYPGVIVEAYSLGLPVITTKWRSIPEIVKHEKTGILIEPKSTEALMAAIQWFNKENYKEMSQNALDYYLSTFQVNKVMETVMKDIKNLY